MTQSIEKGYYLIDREYAADTLPYSMVYLKAGGDPGLEFGEAIKYAKENQNLIVVDINGEIVFDIMRIN